MRETLTSLDLPDAAALVAFSNGAETLIPRDPMHGRVVYVRDDEGNSLQGARFERERLSDGSFVYNLVLAFDREPALPTPVAAGPLLVRKRADEVQVGDWLAEVGGAPLCVESIGSNSLGDVVLRCSFSGPGAYPGTSIMLAPEREVLRMPAPPAGQALSRVAARGAAMAALLRIAMEVLEPGDGADEGDPNHLFIAEAEAAVSAWEQALGRGEGC
jgi:hypothetical protein